jgi:hypothetical protein
VPSAVIKCQFCYWSYHLIHVIHVIKCHLVSISLLVRSCHFILYHVITCHIKSLGVISCHIMSHDTIPHHVISCVIGLYLPAFNKVGAGAGAGQGQICLPRQKTSCVNHFPVAPSFPSPPPPSPSSALPGFPNPIIPPPVTSIRAAIALTVDRVATGRYDF